jgi:hypothetical protein
VQISWCRSLEIYLTLLVQALGTSKHVLAYTVSQRYAFVCMCVCVCVCVCAFAGARVCVRNFVKHIDCLPWYCISISSTLIQLFYKELSTLVTFLHHVSCLKINRIIWFCAALLWFGSLMMIHFGSKHVLIFSVTLTLCGPCVVI